MPKDLNLLLQPQPDQIRHMRLGTDDAQGLGLRQGDLLLIDTLAEPRFGDIVVASISGRWKPRRLQRLCRFSELMQIFSTLQIIKSPGFRAFL